MSIVALRAIIKIAIFNETSFPCMPETKDPKFGINSWLEDELYQEYLHDRRAVDEDWKEVFESNGHNGLALQSNGSAVRAPGGNGAVALRNTAVVPPHQPVSG